MDRDVKKHSDHNIKNNNITNIFTSNDLVQIIQWACDYQPHLAFDTYILEQRNHWLHVTALQLMSQLNSVSLPCLVEECIILLHIYLLYFTELKITCVERWEFNNWFPLLVCSLLLESPLLTSYQGNHSTLLGLSTIHIWATLETDWTPIYSCFKDTIFTTRMVNVTHKKHKCNSVLLTKNML